MTPLPWSPSALNTFKTCGRMYEGLYVSKRVAKTIGPEASHGNRVHSDFEHRLSDDTPLPSDLAGHEDYLRKIDAKPGYFFTEVAAGFLKDGAKACMVDWKANTPPKETVWGWFKIDYIKVLEGTEPLCARVFDWKTGKKKDDFTQLAIYALWVFGMFPKVQLVDVRYYWLVDHTESRKVWNREEVPELWEKLLPDLRQYRDAFKNDIWTPKRSGLCNGYCGDKACEHWQPRRT